MGVIKEAQQASRDEPDMPDGVEHIYWHYKRLRFGRAAGADVVTLIPRQPLQYAEIESYNKLLPERLSPREIDTIMDIDAIFESREAKG